MPGCSYCEASAGKFTTPHTRLECPRRRAMYCYICSVYGHRVSDCPNHIAKAIRQGKPIDGLVNLTLQINDNDTFIKAFLKSKGITPASRSQENQKLLHDYANSLEPPHLLVFSKE